MKDQDGDGLRQLRTLQRWRAAELENAQAEHAALARTADQRKSDVAHVETEITQTQSFARERMLIGSPLSPEALRASGEFSLVQSQQLDQAKNALRESQTLADAAQAGVVQHYENLSVVERLHDRRSEETARDRLRQGQKQLDAHALSRLAADGDLTMTTKNGE